MGFFKSDTPQKQCKMFIVQNQNLTIINIVVFIICVLRWKRFKVPITNYVILVYHWSIKMCIGLSLVICITWRHFFTGTIKSFLQMSHPYHLCKEVRWEVKVISLLLRDGKKYMLCHFRVLRDTGTWHWTINLSSFNHLLLFVTDNFGVNLTDVDLS